MELPFFREMLFLQEREGTLWSQFFPVRVTSFQKGFGVLMSDLPHFKCLICKKPYDKNVVTPEINRKGLVTFNTDIFLFARTVDRNARGLTGKNVNTVYSG